MENFAVQALRGFSLKCKNVSKEKSYFVCGTDKGLKMLQKVTVSCEKINFAHQVKEMLFNNGFTAVDRFVVSQNDGRPFVLLDDGVYTVVDYIPKNYSETNFGDNAEFSGIIRAVAEMHSILKKSFKTAENSSQSNKPFEIDSIYQKHFGDLKAYKKTALRQARLSEYDVLFLKNCDFYLELLSSWHSAANGEEFTGVMDDASEKHYISHNLLKEETVLKKPDGDFFILNFSECDFSHYVHDTASLIKRYIKNLPVENIPLDDVIGEYCSVNPLNSGEINALKTILLFPDNFLKNCAIYYSKKRTWIPAAFLTRMEVITQNREKQTKYMGIR